SRLRSALRTVAATLATWYAERNRYEPPTWSVVVGALVVCLFTVVLASARDLGQWENTDPVVRAWYATVKRSSDGFPCCGEADAYWCDSITVEGDKTFCAITDDRDDGPLMRPHIPIGTKFEITPDKYAYRHGNPTGHSILFVGIKYNTIYCFVQQGGV
ncbi:MAG TPA: hypothetical protein VIY48_02640, partial [Candidatus Paceibacterota bacterium]